MSEDQHIFLGLGSNVGDRYQNLKIGIDMLNAHPHIWVTEKSHVYQSPAMYKIDQDEFYNMVIEIDTNLIPLDLLNEIKTIERVFNSIRNSGYEKKEIFFVDGMSDDGTFEWLSDAVKNIFKRGYFFEY